MAEYPALEISFRVPTDPAFFDRLSAELDDFAPVAIHEDDAESSWRVFFRSAASRDAALAALGRAAGVSATAIDVTDEDWARRSQENLRAIEVGGLIVAPPWDVPGRRAEDGGRRRDLPVIIIEPSTGFGTGHERDNTS